LKSDGTAGQHLSTLDKERGRTFVAPWHYTSWSHYKVGFGQEAQLTHEQFWNEGPARKLGAYLLFMGRLRNSTHGPATSIQRKFLRWLQARISSCENPAAELDRLEVRDVEGRRSILEDHEQYLEPPENVSHAASLRFPQELIQAHPRLLAGGPSNRATLAVCKLKKVEMVALEDPSLPSLPLGDGAIIQPGVGQGRARVQFPSMQVFSVNYPRITAVFTYRKAMSRDLLAELRTLSATGGSSAFSARLLESQQTVYLGTRARYQLHCQEWLDTKSSDRLSSFQVARTPVGGFRSFGRMSDENGWNVPDSDRSRENMMSLYVHDYMERQPRLIQELKSYHGGILRADHTRPLAHKIDTAAGVKWSFWVMNEFQEVIAHAFTVTDGDVQPYPVLDQVDKQCYGSTHTMLEEIFPGILVRVDPFHILWRLSKACGFCKKPPFRGKGNYCSLQVQKDSINAFRTRGSSQLEGIHGCQAKFLSGPNVGAEATQALVMDVIIRHNRFARRKFNAATVYR
ncbi:hypothetical protein FOL47_000320, partial [Perkinsus chesapeaki]